MHERKCIRCGTGITACFGFVLARDIPAAMDGKISWTQVREHCGYCVEWITLNDKDNKYLNELSFP